MHTSHTYAHTHPNTHARTPTNTHTGTHTHILVLFDQRVSFIPDLFYILTASLFYNQITSNTHLIADEVMMKWQSCVNVVLCFFCRYSTCQMCACSRWALVTLSLRFSVCTVLYSTQYSQSYHECCLLYLTVACLLCLVRKQHIRL